MFHSALKDKFPAIIKEWKVYIVRCADKSLYVGIALDVEQRIIKHNLGEGAKYTRSRRPVALVRTETYPNESAARIREAQLKNLSKIEKENLIRSEGVMNRKAKQSKDYNPS